jgi:hypothetical protein
MPGFRGLLVLAIALPLGGCFSVTAPKEVPGWAMSPSAEQGEAPRRKVARRTTPRQAVAQEDTGSVELPIQTGNVAMPTGPQRSVVRTVARPAAGAGPTAFSPEWHARENAADEALRRRMNICSGC